MGVIMARLWLNREETPEGKYLVTRRDGTIPEWSWFVLGSRDPAATAALIAYANKAEELGMDQEYVDDVRAMAEHWALEREHMGCGDPDAPPHRTDDPATVQKMKGGHSA
jgi:hypothetical protein